MIQDFPKCHTRVVKFTYNILFFSCCKERADSIAKNFISPLFAQYFKVTGINSRSALLKECNERCFCNHEN